MELFQAIESRRTVKDFKPDEVPDELLTRALGAGLWAQNHRLSQPWRFAVFGSQAHAHFAEYFPRALTIPAIVAVTCVKHENAEIEREDYAAVACAIQNIQLAAWSEGLGMQWSSGAAACNPRTREIVGFDAEKESLVGLLFFGFPALVPSAKSAQAARGSAAALGLKRGCNFAKSICFQKRCPGSTGF